MMIAKHIQMQSTGKSSILRLVKYITESQDKKHRVGDIIAGNCQFDDPELIAREMRKVQLQNHRAKSDPTYHLMISFRQGEQPDGEKIRKVTEALVKKLGFQEHQWIAVVHGDTDSKHIHIAVNKIHPKRLTIHTPHYDYDALAKECERLETAYGLEQDNHKSTGKTSTERQAGDIEAGTGQESLLTWARRECLPQLRVAKSWDEFHTVLATCGLSIKVQNNGFNIISATGGRLKGSGLDRAFSKKNLEARLGAYKPAPDHCHGIKPEKTYTRKPKDGPDPLKEEFEKLRGQHEAARRGRFDAIRQKQNLRYKAMQAELSADYLKARHAPATRATKQRLYSALAAKRRALSAQIKAEAKMERQKAHDSMPYESWLQFLQRQAIAGREDALKALRGRAFYMARQVENAISGEPNTDDQKKFPGLDVDTITKHGTVIYSFGKNSIRDNGETFQVSRDADMQTAVVALKIAKERFGEILHITGDENFRQSMLQAAVDGPVYVKFADPELEHQRREILKIKKSNQKQKGMGHDR